MGSAQLSPVRLGAEVWDLHREYCRVLMGLVQIQPPRFWQSAVLGHPDPEDASGLWYVITEQCCSLDVHLSL